MPRSSSPVRTPGSHPGNHGFESHTRYQKRKTIQFLSGFSFFTFVMGFERAGANSERRRAK